MDIKCGCGINAVEREVKKEGPNKGKKFYACSKKQGEGCEFFEWAPGFKGAPRTQNGAQSEALVNLSLRMDKMAAYLEEMMNEIKYIKGGIKRNTAELDGRADF